MTKKRLNKWQLEIKKLEDAAHHDIDKVLYETYRDALVKVRKNLKEYEEAIDDLPYYKQVQLGQLRQLENEIVDLLNDAGHRAEEFVASHKSKSLVDGYYQTMYQMDTQLPNPIDFLGLDTTFIRQSVIKPVAGKRFSERLYENREQLARVTRSLINSGFVQGYSMDKIANLISAHTESTRKQALRIARTEGGRLRSEAKEHAYQEAVKHNVNFEIMWVSALDARTRSSHRFLDGQKRHVDGFFKTEDGYEAKGPRLFNVAKEDINCRCTTIATFEGQELKRRDGYGRVNRYKNYQEWEKAIINSKGDEWWKTELKRIQNSTADLKQMLRYRNVLGTKIPNTLSEFQNLKYNKSGTWSKIKHRYYINSRLKDGRWGSKINTEKQAPHMKSLVKEGGSYFEDHVDVQALFNKYAGTGTRLINYGRGANVEVILIEGLKSSYVNRNGTVLPANGIKIHHSKKRTHIVPYRKGE